MSPCRQTPALPPGTSTSANTRQGLPALQIGDVIFIRIGASLFRRVAAATGSWTNHVGIVVDVQGGQAVVGESRFPFSGSTPLARFVARSEGGRVAVARLKLPLGPAQQAAVQAAARARNGVLYDTGFNVHSRRQFCSRYVHEVLQDATGKQVGEVQSFHDLLAAMPQADLGFWRAWYFGSIPWARQTVTPASLLASPSLDLIFDSDTTPTQPRTGPNHQTTPAGATPC